MSLWIDIKYASLLSSRLEHFKLKNNKPFMANFRCHYCGDSQSNRSKKRGYIIEKSSDFLLYYCHNCGKSCKFSVALRDIDPLLYNEYMIESLKEIGQYKPVDEKVDEKKFKVDISRFSKLKSDKFASKYGMKKISSMPVDHPAKKYVQKRKIPSDKHYKLYYTPRFMKMVNKILPNKFSEGALKHDEPRLVIPFVDRDGNVFAIQGRSFNKKSELKYITIVLNEEMPRIYGIDSVDRTRPTIVTEGPIDSMFLQNAVALGGGENSSIERVVSKDNAIFVFDNEPRSKDTIKRIQKAIDSGYKVYLFPENIVSKDINDMILNEGYDGDELSAMIVNGAVGGILANLQLSEWKKV